MQENHEAESLSDEHRVVYILNSIAKCTRSLIFLKLAQIDFHNGQFEILTALNNNELVSVSTAAQRVNIRPSTASKVIELLVQKKLLDRFEDPVDSRRTLIQLTDSGLTARRSLTKTFNSLGAELFGAMPEEEVGKIAKTLASVEHRLKSRLKRLR